jgi:hypothetical protein
MLFPHRQQQKTQFISKKQLPVGTQQQPPQLEQQLRRKRQQVHSV